MSSKVDKNSFEYLNPTALNLSSEDHPAAGVRRKLQQQRSSPGTPKMLRLCSTSVNEDETEILPAYEETSSRRNEDFLGESSNKDYEIYFPS